MRTKIASITQKLALPSVCVLCHQYHRETITICKQCATLLKPIGPACSYCALPLPDEQFLVCGHCLQEKPAFDRTLTHYRFEEPLRTLLHEFKYHEALYLRNFLAKLMLDALPKQVIQTQCLIPVPLHPKRLRQRGFNQAAELSKLLAKQLKIPCELRLCSKVINTVPQVSVNSDERRKNLRQAFRSKAIPYQQVTLVDDLVTTGSTANELARILKQEGVARVDLWCCARAV